MTKKQKLELTWIGKDKQPDLEPRILIEDPDKSYGDKNSENMLIHGDNLLALKALEQDYAGKIKCIYIDPPYNTGSAFEHYDDSLEHSVWLSLMQDRIRILRNLLANDGLFFVQIDDYEADYLKIICDEIFGRKNYRNRFYVARTAKTNNSQFEKFKSYNNSVEYMLCYAKSDESTMYKVLLPSTDKKHIDGQWKTFYQGDVRKTMQYDILGAKLDDGHWIWNIDRAYKAVENYESYEEYCRENGSIDIKAYWEMTGCNLDFIKKVEGSNAKDQGVRYWIPPKGGILLSNNWTDLLTYANDGFFPTAKSEKIMQRVLEISTIEGDFVLDSFLGSATTSAVAHKMGRKWIGVELGEHCDTHCIPRLQQICDGTDPKGISKAVDWKGGGGFKYYELAPSLLKEDKFGNWIISKEYNADMLAAAMAKNEGFRYAPSEEVYWKQGQSTEKDFIFTTTSMVTVQMLDRIHEEMKDDESLLVCCKSFQQACADKYSNITVKKIPKVLLGRCEFGKEDYSLNIVNLPTNSETPDFKPVDLSEEKKEIKRKKDVDSLQPDFFADNEEGVQK